MASFCDLFILHVKLPHIAHYSAAPRSVIPDVNLTTLRTVRQTAAKQIKFWNDEFFPWFPKQTCLQMSVNHSTDHTKHLKTDGNQCFSPPLFFVLENRLVSFPPMVEMYSVDYTVMVYEVTQQYNKIFIGVNFVTYPTQYDCCFRYQRAGSYQNHP